MNGDLASALLWSLITVVAAICAACFGYIYHKDGDKRKLMFTLAIALSSLIYLRNIPSIWETIQILVKSPEWANLPIMSAVLIASFSSLWRLKDFDKPYKVFLFILAASIFMLVIVPLSEISAVILGAFMGTIALVLIIYLTLTRRQIPDVMFLFSVMSFALAGIGMATDLALEFNVLGSFFGHVFLALVFVTSREGVEGGISSFFALKKELERTQEELRTSQEQLVKAERLAAMGELAAMVGHDLRNPLTGITNATYYVKTKLGPEMDEKTKEMLELIEKEIECADKIINDLFEYSREVYLELTETTPKSITKEALSLVKVPENIQISESTQSEPKINVDKEKIKRVFVNIIKNAIEAMPEGGKLTITSKETSGSLKIAFTDTGIGMSRETVEKIGTSLFTTKAKGMGLGLLVCKRFVEAHGGNISVESRVGKGTTFMVTIPIQSKLEGGETAWVNQPESLLSMTTKA